MRRQLAAKYDLMFRLMVFMSSLRNRGTRRVVVEISPLLVP